MTIFAFRFYTVVLVAVLFTVSPSNIATAQTPPASGTAASRLRLIAEEPQPTVTTRTTAPYPATQTAPGAINTDNPPPSPPLPAGMVPEPTGVIAPRRNVDPTVPDAAIRQFMDEPRNEGASQMPSFPEIRLRARIITDGKPPSALIEIGGPAMREPAAPVNPPNLGGQRRQAYQPQSGQPTGVFRTIREGDEFVLPQGDTTSPIRVVKLTGDEVIIEIVNRKTLMRLD